MEGNPERRKYYPGDPETSLSEAVIEALEAHDNASVSADEFILEEQINPDAIDLLFEDTTDVTISVQIHLTNVTIGIWSDGGIDIRVADKME
ncbi:HalOD1 output domain-containing protein [Haladaptatus sp. CMAA 1911]|uniref:HalOD1 output domain-containing protein n=1 Tax=unclassified Haladaptatus TaxID=2622732 RepID=UPI003754E5A7